MVSITWKQPILITHANGIDYTSTNRLEDKPGLYFFSRRFGQGDYEPFYIGQSLNISSRLNQYVRSKGRHETRIRNVIEGKVDKYSGVQLANGPRFFHFGYIDSVQGQEISKTLDFAERALIQYAKIIGWDIINNHHAGPGAFRSFDMRGSKYSYLIPDKLIAHR